MNMFLREYEYPEVVRGTGEILWKWELDGWVCPLQFSFFHEIRSPAWAAIDNLGSVMEPMFP